MVGTNRDGSLNKVLICEQQRMLAQAVLDANREETQDAASHEEPATWERTLADGLKSPDVVLQ